MKAKINWFGLAGSIVILAVVIASLYVPWWQMSIGNIQVGEGANPIISLENMQLANVSLSPMSTDINFLGTGFTVPLIWALNITALLLLLTSGIVMLLYSVLPAKSYSKHLLGYAYKKPLFAIIFFVIPLIAFPLITQAVTENLGLNISIPLSGTTSMALPVGFMGVNMSVSAVVSAAFLWPFWLAIVAAGLCIAARLYHRKVAFIPNVKPVDSAPEEPSPPTPVAPAAPPTPTSSPQEPSPEQSVPQAPSESPAPTTPPPPAPPMEQPATSTS